MFVFVHQRGSGPIRPGPSDFFARLDIAVIVFSTEKRTRNFCFAFGPAACATHPEPPGPMRHRGYSWAAQGIFPAGPSPCGSPIRALCSPAMHKTISFRRGSSLLCTTSSQNLGHRAEQARRSGAAGCSERAARAAGPAVRRNLPRSFLCRKDGKNPYQLPQPGDLSYTLPMG